MTFTAPQSLAVYCGSCPGVQPAYEHAARSLGKAIAEQNYSLVYGGGQQGLMGSVSSSVLAHGGFVTGIVPIAMVRAGGEGPKASRDAVKMSEGPNCESIVVGSMHERKVEMARRSCGFFGLPGGFGTFEEVLEVTTWTQLGIHRKPVVLLNVRGYWNPLRELVKNGIRDGFIKPEFERVIVFVDGPESIEAHDSFDWGEAGIRAIQTWQPKGLKPLYNWDDYPASQKEQVALAAT